MKKNMKIGYWKEKYIDETLPDPKEYIFSWNAEEKEKIIKYLKEFSSVSKQWRGFSTCRICNILNGTKCMTDGTFTYPEGYLHYIESHGVVPPQEFIDHVLSKIK
jgi:hypothetical protein